MAIDSAAYSPKEFRLAFKTETDVGTAVVSSMQEINVDSVELPSLNPTQVFDIRARAGRTAKLADVFTDGSLVDKEISFSGTADSTVLPLLLKNITNSAVRAASGGNYPAAYVIPDSFTPTELKIAQGSLTADADLFTVAVLSPEAAMDIVFPSCRLTSLTISGDMGTENGRIKISGSFKTKFNALLNQNVTGSSSYGSTFYSMQTFGASKIIGGASDCILQSFSLNIENPAEYIGNTSVTADIGDGSAANQEPQVIAIGIPEVSANLEATIKYDSNTTGLDNSYRSGSGVTIHLSNNANWHAATTFGIYAKKSIITSLSHNEGAAMMLDISSKLVADASLSAPDDSLFEIIA